MVPEKVKSVEAVSAEAAARSKGEVERLQKKRDLCWQRTPTAESSISDLHEKLEVVTAKTSSLELESATLRKELGTSSTMYVESEAGISKGLGETRGDMGKKTR